MSNIVGTDVYALFNIPQHDCVKPRGGGGGGGQGLFTQCVKQHQIWKRTASLICQTNLLRHILYVYEQKMPRIELIDESQEQLRKTSFNKPSLGPD